VRHQHPTNIFLSPIAQISQKMVASVAQPAPSGLRKNRRKLSKKMPKPADAAEHTDDEMNGDEVVDIHVEEIVESSIPTAFSDNGEDDDLMIGTEDLPSTSAPAFPPLPASAGQTTLKSETRRIAIPPHRMTPLKKDWINIFGPLTEMLGLQVRMNVQRKCVEVRVRVCCSRRLIDTLTVEFRRLLNIQKKLDLCRKVRIL
jgi:RNA-binding protein PNO1